MKIPSLAKHSLGILLITVLLTYNFFAIGKYSSFPWWHQSANDIDTTIAATTVGLLNNSEIQYIYHPGATAYFFNGIAYRTLALFNQDHKSLFDLSKVKTLEDSSNILDIATRTSRILTLILTLLCVYVLYVILFQLTESFLLSFLFCFYAATSNAIVMHTYMVRSEILSILFLFLTIFLYLKYCKQKNLSSTHWGALFISIGFLLGFSVLSKIQIGPLLVVVTCFILNMLFDKRDEVNKFSFPKMSKETLCLMLSGINFLIMPWWALKRPDFITPKFVKYTLSNPQAHEHLVYGPNPPPNFYSFVFLALILMLILSMILFLDTKRSVFLGVGKQIFSLVLFGNMIITGAILSAYLILLPVTMSFSQYIENTRHLVYSVFTNIFGARIMQHKVANAETISKIFNTHSPTTSILTINVFIFVWLTVVASFLRLINRETFFKTRYYFVIGAFLLGLIMDFLGTLRAKTFYSYYTCYSMVCYTLGFALWTATEWKQEAIIFKKININTTLRFFVIILLSLHAIYITQDFLRREHSTGVSTQTPNDELRNTMNWAKPYWKIVGQSINK